MDAKNIQPIKSGQKIKASDIESFRQSLAKLEGLKVAAPLQLSKTAGGVFLSLAGGLGGSTAKIYKTVSDGAYPTAVDHTQIFPAITSTITVPDDDTGTATFSDSENVEANWKYIYNVVDEYIPVGTYVVGVSVGGEIVTYWRPEAPAGLEFVRGYLDGALGSSSGSSAIMSVWEYDVNDSWHDTTENVVVMTRGSFPASAGVYCTAIGPIVENVIGGIAYEVQSLGCA